MSRTIWSEVCWHRGSARASSERPGAPSPRCRETRGWKSEARRVRRRCLRGRSVARHPAGCGTPALAGGVHHLAEADGPPVAELAGPRPELVPAVTGGSPVPSRAGARCRRRLARRCRMRWPHPARSSRRAASDEQATSRGPFPSSTGAIGEKQAPRTPRTARSVSPSPGSSRTKLLSKRNAGNNPSAGGMDQASSSNVVGWGKAHVRPQRSV